MLCYSAVEMGIFDAVLLEGAVLDWIFTFVTLKKFHWIVEYGVCSAGLTRGIGRRSEHASVFLH